MLQIETMENGLKLRLLFLYIFIGYCLGICFVFGNHPLKKRIFRSCLYTNTRSEWSCFKQRVQPVKENRSGALGPNSHNRSMRASEHLEASSFMVGLVVD